MIYLPKSQPAPECLHAEKNKPNGKYNCGDVLERIHKDFKNKCYICEQSEPTSINIEHFVAHKGDIHLMFDWYNLFYSCAHCNNIKLAIAIFNNILNCTVESDGVDTKIKYEYEISLDNEIAYVRITPLNTDDKTINTARLLTAVYNGTTNMKRLESINLRKMVLRELRFFNTLTVTHENNIKNNIADNVIKDEIIRYLAPSSHFTAFKRWIIRDNDFLNREFGAFL